MPSIKNLMRTRARLRAEKWTPVIVRDLPDPVHLSERTTIGSYSYALQESRIRLLKKHSLIDLGEGVKETPSTVARDYLMIAYQRSPKITHNQAVVIRDCLEPYPLYSRKSTFEEGFYIDIASTFWNVMLIAGWNPDYYPGKWLSAGRPPDDFPFPKHKQARSCLVSVARPGRILVYDPSEILISKRFPQIKVGSPIINLSISKLLSDILNSIALEAVELGAVYANTDGYIAPSGRKAANICQMVLDWGLEPRIKSEGRGEVKGIGAYKVGDVKSLPFDSAVQLNDEDKIHAPRGKKWLQSRFAFWASDRKLQG